MFDTSLNRPSFAQAFVLNESDKPFVVNVNHLKSKGSGGRCIQDNDNGTLAGNCNVTRDRAAQALQIWLAEQLEKSYNSLNSSIRNEKRTGEALKLASKMADGANAELLAEFIQRRLDFDEEGKLIVTSDDGKPTVATLSDLQKELADSGRFDSLLSGTKSSGGAAKPNVGGAGKGIDMSKLSRAEKLEYFRQKRG